MHLYDVNILISAHRRDAQNHEAVRDWFDRELNGPARFGMSELALSAMVRITTNPKVYKDPTPIGLALDIANMLRQLPNCVLVAPGPKHFGIFSDLCVRASAKGNLVTDAYFAAIAIENGCKWFTFDRDYARFADLDWAVPAL